MRVQTSFQVAFGAVLTALLVLTAPAHAGDPTTHFRRALQYEFEGKPENAIIEYRQILQSQPNNIDAHVRLGTVLLNYNGDVDGAISQYVTALGIDPTCNVCQSRLDEAVERRNSSSPENLNRGNDYYKFGQLARSVGSYKLAIFLDPKNADARNSLSWTLYRMGKLNEALGEVKEAIQIKGDEPEFINTLACILYDKGQTDAAIDNWQKAILRSKKANPADLYGLAIGFLSKGNTQRAINSFKEAIKSDPNYADLKYLRDRIGMSVHALAVHDKLLSLAGEPQK